MNDVGNFASRSLNFLFHFISSGPVHPSPPSSHAHGISYIHGGENRACGIEISSKVFLSNVEANDGRKDLKW